MKKFMMQRSMLGCFDPVIPEPVVQGDWLSVATGAESARKKLRQAHAQLGKILSEELTPNSSRTWVSMPRLTEIYTLIGLAGADLTQGLKGNSSSTKRGKMSR